MKPEIVIWDWNGTVLDDLGLSLDAVNYILDNRHLPPIDKEKYYSYLDTPIIRFYEKALNTKDVDFESISFEFNDYYRRNIKEAGLTKGILQVIEELFNMGIPQMIISASHISYINAALKEFALEKYFGAVIAAEDFAAGSKIERAKAYMERNIIPENDRLVIGDTLHDYEMSKSLGGKCILLSSGHEGRDKLSSTDALVLDSLSIEDILSL